MSHINSRSPYLVTETATNLVSATLQLYIYTGQQTVARPSSPTYTLYSTAINEEVIFEIGQLINDKIQFINDNTYRTDGIWVDYQCIYTYSDGSQTTGSMTQKFAVDGYNYYTEGANYNNDEAALLSTDYIRVLEGEDFEFPINRNYDDNGTVIDRVRRITSTNSTLTIYDNNTASDLSGQVIKYINVPYDSLQPTRQIIVNDANDDTIKTYNVIYESECKYDPYKLTFINRWGGMEDLWFFKRSNRSLNVEGQTFQNNNIISGGTYSVQAGQIKKYAITSKEMLSLNTGFIREEFNETFTQLMQSESVWITENNQFIPVNIKGTDLQYKTKLNDKLINYTIEVEYAFNKMNTVR